MEFFFMKDMSNIFASAFIYLFVCLSVKYIVIISEGSKGPQMQILCVYGMLL